MTPTPQPLNDVELAEVNKQPLVWHDNPVMFSRLLATVQHERTLRTEAERLIYVPGQWRCAKCKYVGVHAVFCAETGAVGIRANAKTEICPNGCGPLWPVTERQAGNELCDRLDIAADKINELKSQLAQAQARESELTAAITAFLEQYDKLEPAMDNAFSIAANHGFSHMGGNWSGQLDALRKVVE